MITVGDSSLASDQPARGTPRLETSAELDTLGRKIGERRVLLRRSQAAQLDGSEDSAVIDFARAELHHLLESRDRLHASFVDF
jgi:hypothetical protein